MHKTGHKISVAQCDASLAGVEEYSILEKIGKLKAEEAQVSNQLLITLMKIKRVIQH